MPYPCSMLCPGAALPLHLPKISLLLWWCRPLLLCNQPRRPKTPTRAVLYLSTAPPNLHLPSHPFLPPLHRKNADLPTCPCLVISLHLCPHCCIILCRPQSTIVSNKTSSQRLPPYRLGCIAIFDFTGPKKNRQQPQRRTDTPESSSISLSRPRPLEARCPFTNHNHLLAKTATHHHHHHYSDDDLDEPRYLIARPLFLPRSQHTSCSPSSLWPALVSRIPPNLGCELESCG